MPDNTKWENDALSHFVNNLKAVNTPIFTQHITIAGKGGKEDKCYSCSQLMDSVENKLIYALITIKNSYTHFQGIALSSNISQTHQKKNSYYQIGGVNILDWYSFIQIKHPIMNSQI